MTAPALFACTNPVHEHWQLGPLTRVDGHVSLLGWCVPGNSPDAGVPEPVGRLVCRALTRVARLSFPVAAAPGPVPDVPPGADGDQLQRLVAHGLIERAALAWRGLPSRVNLLTTRRADTAMALFDDALFSWPLQAQIVLLSPPDAAPPRITHESLRSLIGEHWALHAAPLRSMGVFGVLRPGVDGDVAGLLSMSDGAERKLMDALADEARLAGFHWCLLSESDFSDRLRTSLAG